MDKDNFKNAIIEMINTLEDESDLKMLYGLARACAENEKAQGDIKPCPAP